MGSEPPCECTEERIGRNGQSRIVCTCPIPENRKPSLRYGLPSSEWRRISRRIIARDNGICRYCGCTNGRLQADHVIAFSRGGTNDDSNLVAACSDCNRSKGNRSLEEWKARP